MDIKALSQEQLIELREAINGEIEARRKRKEANATEQLRQALTNLRNLGLNAYIEVDADDADAGEVRIEWEDISFLHY